jgi:hypothetical protein
MGTFMVTVTGSSGSLKHISPVTLNAAIPATPSASFVNLDATTQGNWVGRYGSDGYILIGDQSLNPAYVTPVPAGQIETVWAASTADIRALQRATDNSTRIAGACQTVRSEWIYLLQTAIRMH